MPIKIPILTCPEKNESGGATEGVAEKPLAEGTILPSPVFPARLKSAFFSHPVLEVAAALLGKRLVLRDTGGLRSGIIVETEAYVGSSDPAAHSYRKKTARNASMFGPPGTLYVYSIYGCYHCVNVSSTGDGCAVLLRALDPDNGLDAMRSARTNRKTGKVPDKDTHLCNGPSKICQALGITKMQDGIYTCDADATVWFEDVGWSVPPSEIVQCTRIGIEGAGPEAAGKPYRFYVLGNANVSKRDKETEIALKVRQAPRVS